MNLFGPLMALIDRIISMLAIRARSRRELFKEIVEPLYAELTPVAEAYFSMLCRTRDGINGCGSSADLLPILADLRQERDRILGARARISALVDQIQEVSHNHPLRAFCAKVERLFFSDVHPTHRMSDRTRVYILLEMVVAERFDRDDLLYYLNETIRNFESRWVAIAQAHAAFRLRSLSHGVV